MLNPQSSILTLAILNPNLNDSSPIALGFQLTLAMSNGIGHWDHPLAIVFVVEGARLPSGLAAGTPGNK